MKVLITGATGQLGSDLVKHLKDKKETVYGYSQLQLDITNQIEVRRVVHEIQPDVIIHTAAYTQVDQAEKFVEQAYQVNAYGSRNLVIEAEKIKSKFCYISTDYVFDGNSNKPYREYDATNPLSIYGKSKLAGEVIVQSLSTSYFIIRTSWLYGFYGNNFVKTMLRKAKQGEPIKVVNDQYGSPTYSVDLSKFIYELIKTEKYGLYHASNSGQCSWYQLAKTIFDKVGITINIEAISTSNDLRDAIRPKYSVLDHLSIRCNEMDELPEWEDALNRFLVELGEITPPGPNASID
ncbi:dTDP-4-dehydrorhamnose reductase [Paenibacillus sp. y28]|uniref:dTDP-4-dehydrorhamnose reductase n=1 Tax=Paenibacillus sp. y28 TaxID=3129110 RepID=UPI0030181A5B